jgi:hypothetical protein
MERRTAYRLTLASAVAAVAAVIAIACSNNSTSPHVGTPCPTYSGGGATPTTLAGDYTLVSFCQDTLPASRPPAVNGTLTMTHGTTADSFQAVINTGQGPLPLAGPYVLSHDTIIVTLQGLGTFPVAYKFVSLASGDTLYASGHLPGNPPPPIAIIFAK